MALQNLIAEYGPLPATPEQYTGTGRHIFFKYPSEEIDCSVDRVARGIDVRGDGGYVVVAPSLHPTTGSLYRWAVDAELGDIPLADAPDWLVQLALKRPGGSQPSMNPELSTFSGASTMYWLKTLGVEWISIQTAAIDRKEVSLCSAAFAVGQMIGADVVNESYLLNWMAAAVERTANYNRPNRWEPVFLAQKVEEAIQAGKRSPRRIAFVAKPLGQDTSEIAL